MLTRRRKQLGVSLQEILLAMAILTMAIVSAPNLSGFMHTLRARSAVNEIVVAMTMARQLAVRHRQSHKFIPYSTPVNRWELVNMDTGKIVRKGELPNGVTNEILADFEFDRDGRCLAPTLYVGTTPDSQYLKIQAALQSKQAAVFTLVMSPLCRVTTTTEHIEL